MELRRIDPHLLNEDPQNPRRTAVSSNYEAQLAANIKEIGLIQPPLVKERDGKFWIVAGSRRVRACIAAGLTEIPAIFDDSDEKTDAMRAFAENIVRTGLGTVDTWRSISGLEGAGWTEDGIAAAMSLPARTVRRLRLCGNINPTILDQMASGDEPNERDLRVIASASREDQAQAWKKFKPAKGQETEWWNLSRALSKRRLYARDARFDDALAKAHGVDWTEDLFEQGDQDSRYTTQVDAYLGAQHEWMANHLPKKGVILTLGPNGDAKLPPKAERVWGAPKKSDVLGHFVNEQSGKVEVIAYRIPEPKKPVKGAKAAAEHVAPPAKTRAAVTQNGEKMIGEFRTEALHKAFAQNELDDLTLIGLLVLNFCGKNVEVRSASDDPALRFHGRDIIAGMITPGGVLTNDPQTLREAARSALRFGLSLRTTNYGGNSGAVARIAGAAVDADRHLPTMATEEFLSCLSKSEIETVGSAHGVLPRPTGKATRAALIGQLKDAAFIYPGARFGLSAEDATAYSNRVQEIERDAADYDDEGDISGDEADSVADEEDPDAALEEVFGDEG